jgi:orotate phosphoribosyltransferase
MSDDIVKFLSLFGGIRTDGHFVYRNGEHGTAYASFWPVAHHVRWWAIKGNELARKLAPYGPDVIIGPQSLGRELARMTGIRGANGNAIWCDIEEFEGRKRATFPEKSYFASLISGKRVAIVDSLLTGGRTIAAMTRLIHEYGGDPVVAAVLLRRSPNVTKTICNVPALIVQAELDGLVVYTENECANIGPCSDGVPVDTDLGHGLKWLKNNPAYPVIAH